MSKSLEQLKNLACGYEGSAARLTLHHELAREVLMVVKADEEKIAAALACNPATIAGSDLCEMVRRLEEPAPVVVCEVSPAESIASAEDIANMVAAIEASTPDDPITRPDATPLPPLKPQTGRHHRK